MTREQGKQMRDMVAASELRQVGKADVFPVRPPGDRRRQHRLADALDSGMSVCVYCGKDLKKAEDLRMACPALLGAPLPTHSMRITPERAGLRARLANVERVLSNIERNELTGYQPLWDAIAEVRSMIDGIGGE